ncbi:MAG: GMC family oxidoreductase [Rhizobiales bacterium]|nr:GMC family oxidoreductase [Hyphomicrobiales bacterium]
MLFDLQDSACPLQFEVDVCVVGAGPAGITIAKELMTSGLKVCLAESGGLAEETETQALYSGTSIGHPMVLTEGRHRIFGGSATRWGGKSVVLDTIDFETRDWVKNSGWPIAANELQPYYERAKNISNFPEPWLDDADGLDSIGRKIPDFHSSDVRPYVWRCASRDLPRTWKTYFSLGYKSSFDWARAYGPELIGGQNTFVVLHANVTAMTEDNGTGSIREATFKALNGNKLRVRSRMFVLACSGIDNARIALNFPAPLLSKINNSDNLGRYFAQHPSGTILSVRATEAQALKLQKTFNIFCRPPIYPVQYQLGFALSETAMRRHRILNASAWLQYSASEDSPWAAARRLRDAVRTRRFSISAFKDTAKIFSNAGNTISGAFKKYVSAFELIIPNPRIDVIINLEQEPDRESRIRLTDEVDAIGLRQASVDWRISELERKTARVFAEALARVFDHLKLGTPEFPDWLSSTNPLRGSDLAGNYHFIGATRMGESARDGVVDANCRAYGVNNLFFAGASVFPTAGHANPTLTIIALAVRLSDHLRNALRMGDA